MKKQVSMLVVIAMLFSLVLPMSVFAREAKSTKVTHLYAFGDSSIDTGRGRALTTAIVNSANPPKGAYIKAEEGYYWKGRYSNGSVFIELLADHLGVELTNYAVGGAKSGPDATEASNWSSWLPGTGGIEQTKEFVADCEGSVDPNALYFISIGGNDTYNLELPNATVEEVTSQSAANIQEMISDLAGAGGKNFIVSLLTRKPGKVESDFQREHRIATQAMLEKTRSQLGVQILAVDTAPLVNAIEKNPAAYGYKTLSYYMHSDWVPAIGYGYHYLDNTALFSDAPTGYPTYKHDSFQGYDEDGLWNADQYYYYDEYHVTRTTHQNIYNHIKPKVDAFLGRSTAPSSNTSPGLLRSPRQLAG